jgi:hypothetical protein
LSRPQVCDLRAQGGHPGALESRPHVGRGVVWVRRFRCTGKVGAMMRSLKVALVMVVMAVLAATAAASPKTLYAALAKAYPDSELPAGFSAAKVTRATISVTALRHRAVGEVAVAVKGPDPGDFVFYVIFPKHADALADLADARLGGQEHRVGKVPGYKLPSSWYAGTYTQTTKGKKVTHGLTGMFVVDGSVLVVVVTDSVKKGSGNVPAALALLKSSLTHLHRVEAKLG